MPCIDPPRRHHGAWATGLALLAGCSAPAPSGAPVAPAGSAARPTSGAVTVPQISSSSVPSSSVPAPAPSPSGSTAASPAAGAKLAIVALPPPQTRRTWDEVRRQAAQRMVAAAPAATYAGPTPEILLAIPVLEIELNADGSVRRIEVLRRPTQALDTVQLAIEAVRRGAPYGDVSRLPRPWKFVETFLFDDARRFKPRTLDL